MCSMKLQLIVTHLTHYFLQPQYKESELYQARFKQCLSKALNLVKSNVFGILQHATLQVQPKKVGNVSHTKFQLYCSDFLWNDYVDINLDVGEVEVELLHAICHLPDSMKITINSSICHLGDNMGVWICRHPWLSSDLIWISLKVHSVDLEVWSKNTNSYT